MLPYFQFSCISWFPSLWEFRGGIDGYLPCRLRHHHPKRLRKVTSTCEDFGLRRQFSVFVCRLTATDLVRLKSRLYEIIDLDMDQVIFVPLCARCSEQIEALGRPTEPPDARDVVIVS